MRDIFRQSQPLGKVYCEEVVFNTIGSSSPHELESMPRRIQSGTEHMKFVPGQQVYPVKNLIADKGKSIAYLI